MGCHRPVMLFKNNDRNFQGWGGVGDARFLKKNFNNRLQNDINKSIMRIDKE